MAQKSRKSVNESHVGSDPKAAAAVVGKNDFGVHEGDVAERNYASQETRRNDKGASIARSGTGERTAGVGANDSGPGSGSGGDIDVDADSLTGVADPHLKSVPQRPASPSAKREVFDPPIMDRQPARSATLDNDSSTSAADVNNETQHNNEAFKGDITADEASGNSSR